MPKICIVTRPTADATRWVHLAAVDHVGEVLLVELVALDRRRESGSSS
jgi:hypothetical protein